MEDRARAELEDLDRESLVIRAQAAGIRRARILTRPELIDELLRLDQNVDSAQLKKSRGFFGRARDLVARVVERGLHLPDAAERIRELTGDTVPYSPARIEPQAMPTVTLAEIYAAQGHPKRAIETLKRVLEREPEHLAAQALLAKLQDSHYVAPPLVLPPEPEVEAPAFAEDEVDTEVATPVVVAAENGYITGPSYTDEGAEFQLAPESERISESEVETAPTPISPHGEPYPASHTYAIIAAEDKDVDALAITGVVHVLPETEEQPECIAIPMSSGRMFVRWRVSFMAIGTQLGQRPQGRLVVRAHIVVPAWDGPQIEVRDRPVDADEEEVVLQALPEPSVVRVAIGWGDGAEFLPFAHSPALSVLPDDRGLVIWTTTGVVPIVLDDPRAAPLRRALEASRLAGS